MSDSDTSDRQSYVLEVSNTRAFLEGFARDNQIPVGRAIEMAVFAMMTELGLDGAESETRVGQAATEYERLNLQPLNDETTDEHTILMLEDDEELLSAIVITHKGY